MNSLPEEWERQMVEGEERPSEWLPLLLAKPFTEHVPL